MSSFDEDGAIDPTDVEFFKFTGLVPDAKVSIQEKPYDISKYPATVSLIACSNKHGKFVAATVEGFILAPTKTLRKTFYSADKGETVPLKDDKITVPLSEAVQQIKFSADENQILIVVPGGRLLVYNVADIENQRENAKPSNTMNLDDEIADIRPNPEALPNLAAVLFKNNQCSIIDFVSSRVECQLPIDNITAICWSPKGKQIVCGKTDGSLQHFDTAGASKDALSIPEAMSAGNEGEQENRYVCDVLWIENHIFLVLYARRRVDDEDDYINDGYIINRKPSTGPDPVYTRLAEITPIFTTEGRGNRFYMEIIRGLGKEIQHLVIIANAATNEISVVGNGEDGQWATWQLPENGVAALPLSEETSMDTYPLGLALDLSADEKLPPFDASESDVGVEPMPIFYYINDEGHIGSFHCYNSEMARRGESFKQADATASSASTSAASTVAPPAPSGFSAFGAASTSSGSGSFADLLSGKASAAPASAEQGAAFGGFGSLGAPSGGNIPSFSKLGSAPKLSATPSPSGFGTAAAAAASKPAPAPAFGTTTSFGAAANTTNTPAFGATTSFGSAANKTSTPAFGATTSFGSAANKTSTPAFGSEKKPTEKLEEKTDAASSDEKKTETAPTPAFGAPSALGGGGFGALARNTVPGAQAPTTSAFGSTSALGSGGGFGALAKNTVSGAKAPTTSAFGSTSTPGGGFGALAKNTVPGAQAPTTSAFGSTSALGGGGFGALAKNTVPGAKAPTTTAFGSTSTLGGGGGFGALAKNTVPGAKTPTTTAFGSTSTLGNGGGFGSLAKATAPDVKSPSTAAPTSGFASLAKSTVPESKTPAFGGFGSAPKVSASPAASPTSPTTINSPSLSPPTTKPSAAADTTKAPPTTSTPASTSKATSSETTKEPSKSETPKEKIKPASADGMARGFEDLYITVTEEIEELKKYHQKITLAIEIQSKIGEMKSATSLEDESSIWNLNDVQQLGVIADELLADIKREQPMVQERKTITDALVQDCEKSMNKKEDIAYLLSKDVRADVVDIMDDRELDTETRKALVELESKSDACLNIVQSLEFKLQEDKKRNKIRYAHNTGQLSLYSLYRAIRDIERDTVRKNRELLSLEEKLGSLQLNESRRRAQRASVGISCDDLSDSEDEEKEIKPEVIENTARYLRRFHFMDTVCNETSKSAPLEATCNN